LGGIIPEEKEGDATMKLEKTIGNLLRKKGCTLSVAESCTGGLICDRITNVSESSDYFMGGMVNYSNESKAKHLGIPLDYIKRHGAVSPQVARRMAQGVRKAFHTTFGLSTTGVAGPTGGTKRSPIGRVFIGLSDGKRAWVRKLDLKGSRREIKEKATEKALQFFSEKLNHKELTKKNTF
jgi:nicotinamide-nucleotide amidase